jgi:hypothetical protein
MRTLGDFKTTLAITRDAKREGHISPSTHIRNGLKSVNIICP